MLLWQIILLVLLVVCGVLTMFYCFGDSNNPFRHHFRNPTAIRKFGRKCLCFRKSQQETQSIPNIFVISTENNQQSMSNRNQNNNEQLSNSLHMCDLPPSYDEIFDKLHESQRYDKF